MSAVRSVALVAGTLLAGSWALGQVPGPDELRDRPFERPGAMGQVVQLRTGGLRVDHASLGHELVDTDGTRLPTTGVWLLVEYRFERSGEAGTSSGATVVDLAGRIFSATGSGCEVAQPAIPRACTLAFELPAGTTGRGLALRFPAGVTERADDVAVIQLPELPGAVATVVLLPPHQLTAEELE